MTCTRTRVMHDVSSIEILHPGLVAAALTVMLVATACGKSAEERIVESAIAAAADEEVEVERDGDRLTFKSEAGEMKIASGDTLPLPDDLPDDVYLPADYKVRSVMDMAGTRVLALSADVEAARLLGETRAAMQAHGWKETMAMQREGGNGMLAFEKGERRTVVTVNPERDGRTLFGLQLRETQ